MFTVAAEQKGQISISMTCKCMSDVPPPVKLRMEKARQKLDKEANERRKLRIIYK